MTISTNTDFTTVLNNLKQTYLKDLTDQRPTWTVLQELLAPNRDGIEIGDKLNVPLVLTHQGGESYGTSGDTSNLRNPISMEIKDAQTDQFEITQPVRMPFGLISKSEQSQKARFADKKRLIILGGQKAAKRSLELSLLHGSNSLGKVSALSGVTGSGPYSIDVTFTAQSWSDGILAGAENLPFDFYSALTSGTKRNTNDCTVTAVKGWSNDPTNPRVATFQAAASADLSGIQVNDFLFSAGGYAKQMPGLINIMGIGSGSTLFGISTNYSLYRAKQRSISGPITFGKLLSGIAPAVSHEAEGELEALISPLNWSDLAKDFASGRRLDWSYKEDTLSNGAQRIKFKYSGGTINFDIHGFMKDGEIAVFPKENWFRAGSDPDPTMKLADLDLAVMSSAANVFEFRFWSASAVIPNLLATSTLFTGITPNAS